MRAAERHRWRLIYRVRDRYGRRLAALDVCRAFGIPAKHAEDMLDKAVEMAAADMLRIFFGVEEAKK